MQCASALLIAACCQAADRPWQHLVMPSPGEAAQKFREPPPEYSLTIWWWWDGDMMEAEIVRDLREIKAHGINSVMLWAYYGLSIQYLSPTWFDRVRFAVDQARQLDIRVWLMDEGSYPSGFAGGKISKEHPELRMQVLTAGDPSRVAPGGVSLRLPEDLVAAVATNRSTRASMLLEGGPGKLLEWRAPNGDWDISVVRHEFRTSPTRFVNDPGFKKDSTYSFIDPLNTAATRQFVAYVEGEYKKHIGSEFGKTVLGFMGDEPSVAGVPWTADILAEFERRKGYDLRPLLPALDHPGVVPSGHRIRADYWDLWTDLYSERFFKVQTDWCAREGLEYIVHLCGEEDMRTFLKLDGDYFKCNRTVQVPGVDAIWRQIWPGQVADYPKLASSAAHLHGRPRAFTESLGVYGAGLTIEQAKWVIDQQLVRGINQFQLMAYSSSNEGIRKIFGPPNWNASPQWAYFPALAHYSDRLSYLLSVGAPRASIALYYPTTSGWLGDFEAERAMVSAGRELLAHQRDFDYIDEDGLQSPAGIHDGAIWNASGQGYRTVIVPSVAVLSKRALTTLEELARSGGHVIFLGRLPSLITGRSFLAAEPGPATLPPGEGMVFEPSIALTPGVLAHLPAPDLELSSREPALKYLHRKLRGGDVFFLFNEGDREIDSELRFHVAGNPELWDALDGSRRPLRFRKLGSVVVAPLRIGPGATNLVVFTSDSDAGGAPANLRRKLSPAFSLDSDWKISLSGDTLLLPLKTWAEYGKPAFSGEATYRKAFQVPAAVAKAGSLVLDLGEVRYAARVKLNGEDLGPRSWGPFQWDITRRIRSGPNVLEVSVANTAANELAGDPAYYREIESRGWVKNSYIGMYLKFDKEMVSSGLMGPVRILRESE